MAKITLRPVLEANLPILFQQQLDPEAVAMSAYPSKDKGEFMRHWEGILKNKNVIARTIIYKEKIAGHVLCWKEKYEQRIGYWVGNCAGLKYTKSRKFIIQKCSINDIGF